MNTAGRKYEILTKTGKSDYGWDHIGVAYSQTLQGAQDYRTIEQEKNPTATIIIRHYQTMKVVRAALILLTVLGSLVVAELPARAGMCTTMCGPVFCTTTCL